MRFFVAAMVLVGGCGGTIEALIHVAYSYDETPPFIAYPVITPRVASGTAVIGQELTHYVEAPQAGQTFSLRFERDDVNDVNAPTIYWRNGFVFSAPSWAVGVATPIDSGTSTLRSFDSHGGFFACDTWDGRFTIERLPPDWSLSIEAVCHQQHAITVHGSWFAAP